MAAYELTGLGYPWYPWYLAQSLPYVGLKCICGKHPWLLYQAATSTTDFSKNEKFLLDQCPSPGRSHTSYLEAYVSLSLGNWVCMFPTGTAGL